MIEMNKICSPRNAQKNPHGVSVRRGSLWLAVFFISVQLFSPSMHLLPAGKGRQHIRYRTYNGQYQHKKYTKIIFRSILQKPAFITAGIFINLFLTKIVKYCIVISVTIIVIERRVRWQH